MSRPLARPLLPLFLAVLALSLLAETSRAQPGPDRSRWGRSEPGRFMEGVCRSARRCEQLDSPEQIVREVLALPILTDGRTPRDVEALDRLEGDPMAQLEHALKRTVELMGRAPRFSGLTADERLKMVAEELVIEYNSGYWSTLPDDLAWFDRARRDLPGASESRHVAISLFSLDIANSWAGQPTFLLDASVSIDNGPPTHFQMWCDECESITPGLAWRPWEDWNDAVVVTGDGYKNVCLQVRAEPYRNNFANTAIACHALGTPPEPDPDPPAEPVPPSQNPVQRCFGAIGNHCGVGDQGGFDFGLCIRQNPITDPDTATCMINAGSWRHDECCIAQRVGGPAPADEQGSCSPHMAVALDQPYVCQADFNLAIAHLALGFTWTRDVDATVENTTGVVDFAAYCAPTGTVLQFDGVDEFCCSRTGQPWTQHVGDLSGLRWICL